MLIWCAYCQQFQGEKSHFGDFRVSHGICAPCLKRVPNHSDLEFEHSRALAEIQQRLGTVGDDSRVLLVNARGSRHTLATRALALYLRQNGVRAMALSPELSLDEVRLETKRSGARIVLVSAALAEHRDQVVELAEAIGTMPDGARPRIVVGGYAVNSGLFGPIPGV